MGLNELIILLFLFGFLPFIFSFIDILKSEFEGNNKLIWLIAVLFAPFIGPVVYFFVGRKQKKITIK